ncbi:F-box/kelch-repeat protein [Prunus yedoensis var. nudiflora]|uniref:F-box/kelch-repeat protein n=1 Tax=Prunus yedoensis var. nudiflora TaxID=2094558 RepID=A0A314Y434_PRUYE|nr:F-box/kelch-repeat protein [Prunus yedoensis var. nudiflora]
MDTTNAIQDITQGKQELNFPEEIIQDILIRLPVKSLIKCISVSKTWRSMIINQSFIRAHLNDCDSHLLLLHKISAMEKLTFFGQRVVSKIIEEVHSVYYDNQAFDQYNSKIEFPVSVQRKKHNFCIRVVGTCDGLVCLADDMFDYHYNFFIWNPAIRKLVTLPKPSVRLKTHREYDASIGFGFDARTNDYKVVRVVSLLEQPGTPTLAEVYSLATGTWSSLGRVSPTCLVTARATSNVFLNGVLHWPVDCRTNSGDLCSLYWHLTWARRCSEEWEVLLLVTSGTDKARKELVSLDLVSKQLKKLGISGYQSSDGDFYKESLLLLDKTDAESY